MNKDDFELWEYGEITKDFFAKLNKIKEDTIKELSGDTDIFSPIFEKRAIALIIKIQTIDNIINIKEEMIDE